MKTSNLFMVLTKVLLMLMVSISIMGITAIKAKSQDIDNPVTFEQKEKLSFEGSKIEIKGEHVESTNPITNFFQHNLWAMALLIGFTFLFTIRFIIVNAICNDWNKYLDKYREHMINSNCLSWCNEYRIYSGYVYPTYKEYFMFKKWDITDFLKDKKLYEDVMMWNKEVELHCN